MFHEQVVPHLRGRGGEKKLPLQREVTAQYAGNFESISIRSFPELFWARSSTISWRRITSSNSNSLREISSADLIVDGFDLANLVHPVLWRANSS